MNEQLPPLLTNSEAATLLGYAPRSLESARTSGLLGGVPAPKFIKIGRSVRYKRDTVIEWVNSFGEQQNTSQAS